MYYFRNDYSEGCHPKVLEALVAVNTEHVVGYGFDPYCDKCADLIRELCQAPQAAVHFMVGGTQTNFTAIGAFLRPWESVLSPASGHINGHEVGAVEGVGHKILPIQTGGDGKLTPESISGAVEECKDLHLTKPRLVYISNATETGGAYTKAELTALSNYCRAHDLLLFLDGARLGCAFAATDNDLTLPLLAQLTDAFYIGGTKNGAMMGEALVIANPTLQPEFFRMKKREGAVLAKGWLLGVQFQALLEDGLYWEIARNSVDRAQSLQAGLKALGFAMMADSPTNQIFPIVPDALLSRLSELCAYEVWGKPNKGQTIVRLVTSFATRQEDVESFLAEVKQFV